MKLNMLFQQKNKMIRLSKDELLNLNINELQKYAEKYAYIHNKDVNDVKNEIINLHIEALKSVKSKLNYDVFDKLFNKRK